MASENHIGAFRIAIYELNSEEELNGFDGVGDEWRLHDSISVRVADESYSVDVGSVWGELLQTPDLRKVEKQVTGRRTIVKFGNTMQLTHPLRVVIETRLNVL